MPFTQWWLIVPEQPDLSIPLTRVQDSGGSAGNLTSSFTVNQNVQEQVSHAFGRKTAVITHGDIQGEEFALNVLFRGEAEWAAFRAVRESLLTVLVQSDMLQQWNVDMGATRPASVVRAADRTTNPYRIVSLSCIEVQEP